MDQPEIAIMRESPEPSADGGPSELKLLEEKYRSALLAYQIQTASEIPTLTRVDAISLCSELAAMIEHIVHRGRSEEGDTAVSANPSPVPSGMVTPANGSRTAHILSAHAPQPAAPAPAGISRTNSASSSVWSLRIRPVMTSKKAVKTSDEFGNRVINNYTLHAELGRGSFGLVMLATVADSDELRAVKVIDKARLGKRRHPLHNNLQSVYQEIAVMKKLRHKNVVTLHEVIDDPEDSKMYIVMQYVEKGRLRQVSDEGTCTPLSEDEVRRYMRQVLSGLRYIHRHGILHRDLKPDNILLGNGDQVLLADFGVSEIIMGLGVGSDETIFDSSMELQVGVTNATKGTPAFFPPEIFRFATITHPEAIDIWAFGVTMYILLYGVLPFNGSTHKELGNSVVEQPLQFPESATSAQRDLLSKLLQKEPEKRISLSEARHHPFFVQMDASAVFDPFGLTSPSERVLVLTSEEIMGAITTLDQVELDRTARPFSLEPTGFDDFFLPPALANGDTDAATNPLSRSPIEPQQNSFPVPAQLLSPRSQEIVRKFVTRFRDFPSDVPS
jgi:serine/threonine protein kinase